MNGWSERTRVVCAIACFGLLSVGGCLGDRSWDYPPKPNGNYLGVRTSQPIASRLVVLPLTDLRSKDSQTEYWKVAIPLIPSGVTAYERPETAIDPEDVDVVRFHPSHDFARALADEIREAGVFSSVTFVEGASVPSTDLVLRGHLRSTRWEREITTYLLGPFGTVFWILGLPMGNTTTTVEMDLELTPAGDPSNIVWSFAMSFEGWQLDSPYYGLKETVRSYPMAVQDALRPAVTDLVDRANKHPESLQAIR